MTGTSDLGPWQMNDSIKVRPNCLFAVSINPLERCQNVQVKGKIYCKDHVGKKESQEAGK